MGLKLGVGSGFTSGQGSRDDGVWLGGRVARADGNGCAHLDGAAKHRGPVGRVLDIGGDLLNILDHEKCLWRRRDGRKQLLLINRCMV